MTTATPEAPATLKLSAAIRKGYRLLKGKHLTQITEDFYRPGEGACAMGMAYVSMAPDPDNLDEFFYFDPDDSLHTPHGQGQLDEQFRLNDFIPREQVPEILKPTGERQLASVIYQLNDDHKWTIPQIATWLESIGR